MKIYIVVISSPFGTTCDGERARYPQLVTLTKNKGITLKIQDDEQSARRHIPMVHIGAGHNTRGSSRMTPNLLTTQCQRRFQLEALKTELKQMLSLQLQNSAEQPQPQKQQFPI
jgi:hypothetical protein